MKSTAAIVAEQGAPFALAEVEIDGPRDDEVLVRIEAAGLCHTDLTIKNMLPDEMFPHIFGHEGAGVVEAVGAGVTGINVGDHVVLSMRSCRTCAACQRGAVGYCEQSLMLNYMGCRMDGTKAHTVAGEPVSGSFFGQSSFARHSLAYADNVVVIDKKYDFATAAPFGCGFQTGAGSVLNILKPGPEDSFVVYGAGAVGLAAVAAAVATGVGTVIAVDLQDSRLSAAAELGATPLNPSSLGDVTLVDRIKELTSGGAATALDTTAVPEVVHQAVQALRSQGQLVVVGLGATEYTVDAIDIMQNGKIIRGSIEGDADPLLMVPRLLEMFSAGSLPLDRLIRTYDFAEIETAVADVEHGLAIKAVLVW